jgi:hypothetical protein
LPLTGPDKEAAFETEFNGAPSAAFRKTVAVPTKMLLAPSVFGVTADAAHYFPDAANYFFLPLTFEQPSGFNRTVSIGPGVFGMDTRITLPKRSKSRRVTPRRQALPT